MKKIILDCGCRIDYSTISYKILSVYSCNKHYNQSDEELKPFLAELEELEKRLKYL
jgi:hypothetical protein